MLSYNFASMLKEAAGVHGSSEEEIKALEPRLADVHKKLAADMHQGEFGFAHLPEDKEIIPLVQEAADYVRTTFDSLIVVGIGGSDLGARALLRAFRTERMQHKQEGVNVFFLGASTDPEEIAEVLAQVDLAKTAINIVSKSGGTIEPMSTFLYLREKLIEAVGFEQHGIHIIATTDPTSGILKTLMDTEGHRQLPIPEHVGGRFSVLSSVGLFPAACAGIDIKKLLKGASKMNVDIISHKKAKKNAAFTFAALQFLAWKKRKQNITVMMLYSTALKDMGAWFVQLWAESLGKAQSRSGRTVNAGPTPMTALGPTDQHSQLQLWNEGPYDKVITFITVKKFREEVVLPKDLSFIPDIGFLAKKKMSSILTAEYEATAESLTENKRPHGTIELKEINEQNIGALFIFLEWAVVYMAELMDINAFNQPGVERSKELIKEKLSK